MRVLPAIALSGALMLGACTNPDGSLNVPGTLALGAGAAVAGLAIASASDDKPRYRQDRGHYRARHGYHGRPAYAGNYGYGPPRGYGYGPYRRW